MQEVKDARHISLVDCTLRDGGYYNDWDFSFSLIQHYVESMVKSGVDVIELGFRTLKSDRYLGPTAYTTDEFIDQLNIPRPVTLAVMLNAKEVVAEADPRLAIGKLFKRRTSSRVDLVRFAANHNEINALAPAIDELHNLGYEVALNLMQISDRSIAEVQTFGARCREMKVDIAYIADSFGGLRPHDIAPIIQALARGFEGPVGCHLHDNMTYALSSTLAAVSAGATWVDSTVMGMGRGPGNVKTEYLALELVRLGLSTIDVAPMVNLIANDFTELQRKYEWGSNFYYFMSANHGIHPTYVMELTKDGRYPPSEIVGALEHLGEQGAANFDRARLVGVTTGRTASYDGTFDLSGWCAARTVLILGPGAEARAKAGDLELLITKHQPIVICLGAFAPLDAKFVDAVVVCHPERAALEANALKLLQCPIFAPQQLMNELGITCQTVRDVGFKVTANRFAVGQSSVDIPRQLSAAYAIAIAAAGGAKRILLAGFDGFTPDDERFAEMQQVFESFALMAGTPPITAITRTRYDIKHSSIFAPY